MYSRKSERLELPIDKFFADPESSAETLHGETPVALEQLAVCEDAHFANVETCMRCEYARREQVCLFQCCCKVVR